MTLKRIRTILAVVMFVCITWLFVDFTGTAYQWFSWMPKIQLLEAILAVNVVAIAILVVGTLIFGRVYCSVICPLGILQDVIARFNRRKNKYSYSKALSWLRYTMLGVMVVALVAGVGSVFQLLAPYSAYGRIATTMFQPIWKAGNNVLASIAEHSDSYLFYHVEQIATFGVVLIIAVVTFIALVILAVRNGRTYCNTICPVGTLLSFFARFSFLKIRFNVEKCKNCSMCSKNCKAACIDYKTHTVDYSRCVTCGNCIDKCKFGALSYSFSTSSKKDKAVDASKRSFLLASALVSTAAMAQKKEKLMDGGIAELEEKVAPERQTPLTPPGSLSYDNMAKRCTGCQLCVSECPNHVLRPSNDLMHLMLPTMSYERGYCRPECTRCSEVCPAGAIKPLDDVEKSSIQIGHAVWIKKNCVVLTDEVECGNCARHCPSGAIEMVPLDENNEESPMVPAINEAACIGCGACEYVCPSRPFSAIFVEGHEVHRKI
ncbi:4Fe-4S binding domain-containing protein [Prevotella sp. ne3005]|uniref:4Fe-4S binding protein n=1 Tax=Prevotella sp. ne3005 TaxID=1761887 RepID=UPI0008AF37FB|nr:4Fe-4S binding protein [Prevotella sp. ne3005]SEN27232.1 4Fe-4S binding domain-containing protein [Prevotella sp. ne3005]